MEWLTNLRSVLHNYSRTIGRLHNRIDRTENAITQLQNALESRDHRIASLERLIADVTSTHADLAYGKHGTSYVIVIGHYREKDLVQTFRLDPGGDFDYVVETLRDMSRTSRIGRIDGPPIFKQAIDRFTPF